MRPKSIILLLLALGCGGVAAAAAMKIVTRPDGGGDTETTPIFVVSENIRFGTTLTMENVKLEPWPTEKVPEGALTDEADVLDRTTKYNLAPGQVITDLLLHAEGETPGHASITIPPGYRAVPLKGSLGSVVGGLLQPGDHVDVLVYIKPDKRLGIPLDLAGTRTILENVLVYAIDQQTHRKTRDEDDEDKPSKKNTGTAKSVTLLLNHEQSQKLALAEEIGKIRLIIRNPDDEVALDSNAGRISIETLLRGEAEVADQPDGPDAPDADDKADDKADEPAPAKAVVAVPSSHMMVIQKGHQRTVVLEFVEGQTLPIVRSSQSNDDGDKDDDDTLRGNGDAVDDNNDDRDDDNNDDDNNDDDNNDDGDDDNNDDDNNDDGDDDF